MRKISMVIVVMLTLALASCAGMQTQNDNGAATNGNKKTNGKKAENHLKGTNTEIMNAFKSLLGRYEFDEFSMSTLKITTKIKKLTEDSPYYAKHKKNVDIYEQYKITITRKDYDAIVDVRYSIMVQEMNMKTSELGFKEIVRESDAEKMLIKKIKRLLYGT